MGEGGGEGEGEGGGDFGFGGGIAAGGAIAAGGGIAVDRGIEVREVTEPWEGALLKPSGGSDVGVLVVSGSSGRIETARARLFAEQGIMALTIRWFGGPGQPKGITEIPLETFTAALDLLQAEGAQRLVIQGISKGAEAGMLTAIRDSRVDAVIACSPGAYVQGWAACPPLASKEQRPYVSCWTWQGEPLPFVPADDAWLYGVMAKDISGPIAVHDWYMQSEDTFADRLEQAAIPVENTGADIVLVAGGDDEMWPSLRNAEMLAARRRAAGASVHLIASPDAGHCIRLPGEAPLGPHPSFLYGGSHELDSALGAKAWPVILDVIRGRTAQN